jgi:GTP cyclohydrolase I
LFVQYSQNQYSGVCIIINLKQQGDKKMADEKKFLVDVGMRDLPFPMRVMSKVNPDGQFTIANVSITARIMREFEVRWIDKFIQVVHEHRDRIGAKTLRVNIMDYLKELNATTVRIDFDYPFFIEKLTPVSKEKCLVRYLCTYSAKASSIESEPKIFFKMEVPAITTYPASDPEKPGGLFGQLSIAVIEIQSRKDVYPEDLVDIVDKHALSPVYSFLTEEDQIFIIQKVHSEKKTSVVMTDGIRGELAHNPDIGWYSVRASNFGMLHSYSTVIWTEKSSWVPFSGYEGEI